MQITIIKNNKLNLFQLPEHVSGSHWITDFENGRKINLINVEASEMGWKIISNPDAYIMDEKDVMVPYAILKEYNFYVLKNNYKNEKYYIYCSPVYDNSYKELGIREDNKIVVGNDSSAAIYYTLGNIPKQAFCIEKRERYYYVTLMDSNALVYVNHQKVLQMKRIEYGDIIFMFGLKIIMMRRDGYDYLLVNNPNNLLVFNASFVNVMPNKVEYVEDHSEISDDSTFLEDHYFYRTPHFYEDIGKFILKIDAPPSKKEEDKTPAILTIGPMVTMSMMSVVMLLSNFKSIGSGERTIDDSMTSIIMCVVMLASSLLWPILTRLYQKFMNKMEERKRQKLYKKYIDKKEKEIEQALAKQRSSLLENNFSVLQCQDIIRAHNVKLWQRRILDDDFLNLPVGIGNVPMQIEIQYPEEHFSLTEDNLLDLVHEIGKRERIIRDIPITYSVYENKITGIVGNSVITKDFIDRYVLQMMTNYSYDELKIVTFTSSDNEGSWDYIKTLPHSWSNDHTLRYFGSSNDDYREIIYHLENVYNERKRHEKDTDRSIPHYVIITDAIKSIDSYDFIKNLLSDEKNYGFSILIMVDRVSACPNECKNFISVNQTECAIFNSVLNSSNQPFQIDYAPLDELYNCARELANILVEIRMENESSLPDTYHFLEMYQVGKVEQLNAIERWKKSNPMLSLQVPLGIGKSGEIISLDLHEKYHGPHGLVAGTTGSGKSEFIISYVLSLAINYSPYEVQVILIDYKGGSLAGSFQNDKYVLPHLAGTITNLDGNELNRSLASIESEIKRRQQEFNEARVLANESTIDIYKYQKLWREGRIPSKEPISHLFIISDEFAELKEQQPEFMDKLISTARVGRSLGIHLILATQKPGGVVDPQIWSNTRFRVCLKVQDTGDSQEVLKKPDAAYLKKTGRFYLQVGYDEVYTLGQAAWAGGQYYPNPTFKKDIDTSVNVINNIGFVTMTKDIDQVKSVKAEGEELSAVVKYLSDIARNENIQIRKLWLPKIPDKIYVDSLKEKYHFVKKDFMLDPIIGEYDDPNTQNQYALSLPLSKYGNALIYGIAGSGKEDFLTTLLYSLVTSYSSSEVHCYIMDFGAETLRCFKNFSHVGDVVYLNDYDKILNLFKMLEGEIEQRKSLFANYGGSYESYISSSDMKCSSFVVIINNYEAFLENYEDINDRMAQLSRDAFKYGIHFVITASNDNSVRIKVKQNFTLVYALQQNNDSDYSNILGNCRGKIPAKIKGRGLFKKDHIYEFQTAIVQAENQLAFIQELASNYKDENAVAARRIPVLPEEVNFDYIRNELALGSSFVVGVSKEKLQIEKYNFAKNIGHLISSYEIELMDTFLQSLVKQMQYTKYYDPYFINTTDHKIEFSTLQGKVYQNNFNELIQSIFKYVEDVYQLYEREKFDENVLKRQKKIVCFIYGLSDFFHKLDEELKKKMNDIFKKDSQMNLVSFVFVDNPDIIKTFAYEEWFKTSCDTSKGIWIGSGVSDESLFKISKISREDREDISFDYGYLIYNSKLTRIKLLSSFEPEERN